MTEKTGMMLDPSTLTELVDAVRSTPRMIAVGAGTKPRLARVAEGFARVSTAGLRGIVEYEPSEFTFTALAGTPVKEIAAALAERGQYLPFDPPLAEAGATLGGTVAAGLSGSGRFRFGGLRDFILGVQFVDGEGRLLRMGGKVVKNAAGFDLPKFFVGSAGRFGVLAEITFKVFPRPPATRTLRLDAADGAAKARLFSAAANGRWEIDALDAEAGDDAVLVRLAAPAAALEPLAKEMLARWPGRALADGEANALWRRATEFAWAHAGGTLAKFALTPAAVSEFCARVNVADEGRGWVGAGGNVGYVSVPTGAKLPLMEWPGVTLWGEAELWPSFAKATEGRPGAVRRFEVMRAVKAALDPQGRFPELDE